MIVGGILNSQSTTHHLIKEKNDRRIPLEFLQTLHSNTHTQDFLPGYAILCRG